MKKVIAISKYDSFTKISSSFLLKCIEYGYKATLVFIKDSYKLSARQLNEVCLTDIKIISIKKFKDIDYLKYDFIYLGLTGGPIKRFSKFFYEKYKNINNRPIIICGYPGVILASRYIGYSNRTFCDIILLNSIYDFEKYKKFSLWYNLNYNNAFVYGYSFEKIKKNNLIKKNIIFAEQSVIPKTFRDRMYLVGRLLDYAEANPDDDIIIKPRIKIGEKTVFRCKYPFEKLLILWSMRRKIPQNISFSYEKIEKLLTTCSLLITVSSTVAIQSIYYRIPTAIIGDFGTNEEMGIDFYMNSGCVTLFDKLISKTYMFNIDEEWFNKNIIHCDEKKEEFFKFLEEKINKKNNLNKNIENFNKVVCSKYNNFLFKINLKERIVLFLLNLYYLYRRFS